MTRLKHKTQKRLRGGSVPYLNSESFGIKSSEDLQSKFNLYGIFCHGQTTIDKKFFIVPAGTYCMFTAHSGEPAEGENIREAPYIGYKNTKSSYYQSLYKQLFQPRPINSSQYSESLYIYEPGDVLPDYQLFFRNNPIFMFRHGVYTLPIESDSGKGFLPISYLGRPLTLLQRYLKEGKLQIEELDELNQSDRQAILEESAETLEKSRGIPTTDSWFRTKLRQKIETMCCRTTDNLLFQQSSEFQEQFADNVYKLRLSQLLQMLPKDPVKKRFLFMSFCRVSMQDIAQEYTKETAKYPILLRTLSFSGKCSKEDPAKAFNILQVTLTFCKFPLGIKRQMIKEESIRSLIRKLKMILPKGWKNCLEGTYLDLPGRERVELLQKFQGYLSIEDIVELTQMYPALQTLQMTTTHKGLARAYEELAKPFKTLDIQLGKQSELLYLRFKEKNVLIKKVYQRIQELINPVDLPSSDFLQLRKTTLRAIEKLLESLEDEDTQTLIEHMKEKQLTFLNDPQWIEGSLQGLFRQFMGETEFIADVASFPKVEEIENTSISFNNLNSNSNTNTNTNTNMNTNTNTKNGGYKRKTRRRLVRKQKTSSTAKNT